MTESATPAAPAADPSAEPVTPANDPASGLPANDSNGEGTTPEEVAKVLKSSGIDIEKSEKQPKADDEEEGEDPDEKAKPTVTDDEEPEEEEKPKPVAKKEEPAPDDSAEDKYSFQVEDANGVTYKITADADIEDVLKEFEPKNNGQIIKILDQLRTVKDQKTADDAKAVEDTAAEERRTRASEMLTGWQEEAKALQGDKRIPEGKDGETRINEVYKFMSDENGSRMKANKPTLNSFEDALDKMEAKEAREKAVEDAKTEKETARKNGNLVGGASAPASSGARAYRAGSAKNANQALRSMGMLE